MIPKKLIADLVDRIKARSDPEKIVIFGSQTRSSAQVNSDIDIAVSGVSAAQAAAIREILNDELETLLDIDVVSLDELSNEPLKRRIEEEGMVVYERDARR